MIRISLSYIYQIAEGLDPLERLQDGEEHTLNDIFPTMIYASNTLEILLRQSALTDHFRSSLRSGNELLKRLNEILALEFDKKINQFQIWHIKQSYNQYKIALLAELEIMPSYLVSQKSSYDTLTLLDRGYLIFPADLPAKVPEAVQDLSEAGKALAFDMPTACGYHVFRAAEAVLRRYYKFVTGGKSEPKVRNIPVYVNAMRNAKCGNEKILNAISQLAKLHRNPLIHPEIVLSTEEAIATIGMARSIVTLMINDMPFLPPTTSEGAG